MKKLFMMLLVLVVVIGAPAPWVSAQTVRAGYTSKTIFYLPFFAAQKKGFYEAEGLQVQLIQMGSSSIHLQALIAGEIHFANISPDGPILYNEKGGNLKVIAGVDNAAPYVLIGGKNHKRLEDLKGAKLGASSLKGGATTLLVEYLKAKGLHYPRDYTIVVIAGGTPARLSALESGAIAAVVLGIPVADIAIDRGFHRLGDVLEVLPKFQFTAVHTNPAWAEKNRATVVKFLKAHIRSFRWIYDRPDEAADFYMKEAGVQMPYARKGIDYFIKNQVYPRDGAPTLEGLKANIEVQAKDGLLTGPLPPVEKYVDLSYIKQAQKQLP
jgi:NitT/TauT family transport system substrate-binding protein